MPCSPEFSSRENNTHIMGSAGRQECMFCCWCCLILLLLLSLTKWGFMRVFIFSAHVQFRIAQSLSPAHKHTAGQGQTPSLYKEITSVTICPAWHKADSNTGLPALGSVCGPQLLVTPRGNGHRCPFYFLPSKHQSQKAHLPTQA